MGKLSWHKAFKFESSYLHDCNKAEVEHGYYFINHRPYWVAENEWAMCFDLFLYQDNLSPICYRETKGYEPYTGATIRHEPPIVMTYSKFGFDSLEETKQAAEDHHASRCK